MGKANTGAVGDSVEKNKPDEDAVEIAQTLSAQIYQNPKDFVSQLDTAAGAQVMKDSAVLNKIEGNATPFELVAMADTPKPQSDGDKVVSKVEQNGKVVREHLKSGDDLVVAYDDKGKAHRFPDEKITKLPVDMKSIPDWRVKQITPEADKLIKKYTEPKLPDGSADGRLSFHDMSSMMKDIGKMDNLTEVEKCKLWSEVRIKMQKNDVTILDADEKSKMIDSWKGSDDPWHALITMDDGYHGNKLINMSEKDATAAIKDHENGGEADKMGFWRGLKWNAAKFALGVNTGDIEASEGQLRALRELRSKGTFSAYADEWTKQFVREDRDQYGRMKRTK